MVPKECGHLKNVASARSLMTLTKANKRGRGIDNLQIFKPKEDDKQGSISKTIIGRVQFHMRNLMSTLVLFSENITLVLLWFPTLFWHLGKTVKRHSFDNGRLHCH